MFGAEGFSRIENASVCLQPDAVMYGDGLIGANFFDQVQILLDGPAETLGIIDGMVANAMLTLPAHVRAPVSPLDDERIDRERLNSGLSAYYPLDGNAWDAGGNGNHGTVIGPTPAADRQCIPFGAFRYDGRGDMISVDRGPSLEFTQGLSNAAWVHPDVRKRQAIIWKGPYVRGPDASPYRLTLGDAGEIIFELRVRSSPLPVQIVKAGYPTGEWFFVVGTFDGASMKLYVDGLLAGTAAVDGPLGQSRAPLLIGTGQNLSMDTFQGRLDDVRIYDRALSSAEVEALYFGPIDEVASAITSAMIVQTTLGLEREISSHLYAGSPQ